MGLCPEIIIAALRRATLQLLETYGVAIGYTIAGPSALCRNMRLVSDSNFEHPTRRGFYRTAISKKIPPEEIYSRSGKFITYRATRQ